LKGSVEGEGHGLASPVRGRKSEEPRVPGSGPEGDVPVPVGVSLKEKRGAGSIAHTPLSSASACSASDQIERTQFSRRLRRRRL
jgi:hypothetical protein